MCPQCQCEACAAGRAVVPWVSRTARDPAAAVAAAVEAARRLGTPPGAYAVGLGRRAGQLYEAVVNIPHVGPDPDCDPPAIVEG